MTRKKRYIEYGSALLPLLTFPGAALLTVDMKGLPFHLSNINATE